MPILGTALLAFCLIAGLIIGNFIGAALGMDTNVGGVGIGMLLLVLASNRLQAAGRMSRPTESGILFWSAIYIPIVVAMAASQNVLMAVTGGPAAILAGTLVVVVCFALLPLVSCLGRTELDRTWASRHPIASEDEGQK